jgi:hypothetical protein
MSINLISIIGVDNHTDFSLLDCVAKRALCNVEFGVLYSLNKSGDVSKPRYPNINKIAEFAKYETSSFKKSLHLCGKSVLHFSQIYHNYVKNPLRESKIDNYFPEFRAIQLNFNTNIIGSVIDTTTISTFFDCIITSSRLFGIEEIVIQVNDSKKDIVKYMVDNNLYNSYNFRLLYDSSGGYGKPMTGFKPPFENFYTGYAGGITPESPDLIYEIERNSVLTPVYIDMESGVRDSADYLSIKKCSSMIDMVNKIKNDSIWGALND